MAPDSSGDPRSGDRRAAPLCRWLRRPVLSSSMAMVAMLLAGAVSRADEPSALSLDECLSYAYEHNLDLRIARTESGIGRARVHEAGARYLPSLSLDGYYQSYDTTPSQSVTVPPNLRVQVGNQTASIRLLSPLTVQTTPRDPSDMKLALSQPLFTSGKLGTALAIRRAEEGVVTLQEAQVKADVGFAVERTFAELLVAEQGLALTEEMTRQTTAVLGDVRQRFAAQTASRMEVLEAESADARAQLPLFRVRQDVSTRRDELTQLIGWDADRALAVRGELTVVPVHAETEALVRRALAERADLRLAEQQIAAKERELTAVKLTNTPSLSLVGAYEFVQRARNDLPENVLSGGVVFNWPILEGGTLLPRLQAARLALEEATLRREQLRRRVALDVRTAVAALEAATEAQRTQERAVMTARERVRASEVGLRAGTTAPIGLAREQAYLLDARLTEAHLRLDHVIARARLGYLVGAPPGRLEEP